MKFSTDISGEGDENPGQLVAGSFMFTESFLDELKAMFRTVYWPIKDGADSVYTYFITKISTVIFVMRQRPNAESL